MTAVAGIMIGMSVCVPSSFAEDTWPSRPVTLIVPFAAGGPVDAIGRILGAELSPKLGQQIVVENVGGAGGMIGATRVARGPRDGYQLILGNVGTHASNQTLYRHPQYNVATDFVPVALVAQAPMVLLARKDFPAKDIPSFVAYIKANEKTVQFGSGGVGSTTHLSCALFNAVTNLKVTHVPYRGGSPAVQDLIGGRIDYVCIEPVVAAPLIEAGTAKAIAVLSAARSPSLPNLSTAQEQGLAGFDVTNWFGLFAPSGTPDAIVTKLHDLTVAAMATPSAKEKLKNIGAEPIASERQSSAYFKSFVESEIKKWEGPIKANGLQID
ncbi:MAG: Bug family tripartite tricarboxylate transporter substrate binding protein [Variibacter sp.]